MKENEVLARFHGWRHSPTPKGKGAGLWYFPEWNKAAFKSTCFLYDKSWDWLMPVVEKICQHVYNEVDETHKAKAFLRTFGMRTDEGKWMVRFNRCGLHEADTLIEATFKACVEFIEWYNANKQL